MEDLGTLVGQAWQEPVWALPHVVGRGVLSLLSGPPGIGKGWWLQGLPRAMQDGTTFYGLPTRRLRVLWATEEGASLARTARRFGIQPGQVAILRRDRVPGRTWPELVKALRREAAKRQCGLVVIDTVRAWVPGAEQTPEQAMAAMAPVRTELTEPGLAVLVVHHARKGGGEHGEGVAGTNALVGAVDILIELHRVKGRPDARRMVTSRRFEPLDITATLHGHRYLADGEPAEAVVPEPERQYLRSPGWATRRAAILARAAGRCERCGAGAPAEVHHRSYARLG
ncbi:MAG: AAA family ATPase, partial [Chloroflexota bacterium]